MKVKIGSGLWRLIANKRTGLEDFATELSFHVGRLSNY